MIGARGGRIVHSGPRFGFYCALSLLIGLFAAPEASGADPAASAPATSAAAASAAATSAANIYYVDSGAQCPGSGTQGAPWCNFSAINSRHLGAGDQVLLKRGDTFTSQLVISGTGNPSNYVTVASYGSGPMPVIDGRKAANSVGINLYNDSYVEIEHIAVKDALAGILINNTKKQTGLRFLHLYLSGNDVGIQSPSTAGAGVASNILVQDVTAVGNTLGCALNSCSGFALALGAVSNVVVDRLFSSGNCGATSWSLGAGASNVLIENSKSTGDAGCAELGGETANFLDNDTNVAFVNDIFVNAPFNRSGVDFSAIDLEPADGPDRQVSIEDNFIANNAGPGIEILDHPAAITDLNIAGNVLVDNGAHWSPVAYPVLGQIWTDEWLPGYVQSTGSITDNLYDAPAATGGFEQAHAQANYGSIAQSGNIDLGSPGNVWYAADGFRCGTQGANRWSYQSSPDGSKWTDLSGCTTVDSLDQEWDSGGTSSGFVSNFEELPPSQSSSWVARSWTAPSAGWVSIRGRVLMSDPTCGSGVRVAITKSGSSRPIWGPRVIRAGDHVGLATNLNGVTVHAGTVLHFAVQEHGSTQCRVSWTPSVAR